MPTRRWSTPNEVKQLILRIVTGDGAQLENLEMSDDEWRAVALDSFGPDYVEHFEVTMRFDDWLLLVHLAAAYARHPRR